jgi:hypothetical protein
VAVAQQRGGRTALDLAFISENRVNAALTLVVRGHSRRARTMPPKLIRSRAKKVWQRQGAQGGLGDHRSYQLDPFGLVVTSGSFFSLILTREGVDRVWRGALRVYRHVTRPNSHPVCEAWTVEVIIIDTPPFVRAIILYHTCPVPAPLIRSGCCALSVDPSDRRISIRLFVTVV